MQETLQAAPLSEAPLESDVVTVSSCAHKQLVASFMKRSRALVAAALMMLAAVESVRAEDAPAASIPEKPKGTLVIVGGGVMPADIGTYFMDRAEALAPPGEEATIGIIPSASEDADKLDMPISRWWTGEQRNVVFEVLHAKNPEEARSPEFAARIKKKHALWVPGGRQRVFLERYMGTPVEQAFYDVYHRGGLVGGTSAGAAVSSRLAILDGTNEDANLGRGFDLLQFGKTKKCVIDQHFLRRRRDIRLEKVVREHPDHTGVGVDESTALIVEPRKSFVLGDGSVHIYSISDMTGIRMQRFSSGQEISAEPTLDVATAPAMEQ